MLRLKLNKLFLLTEEKQRNQQFLERQTMKRCQPKRWKRTHTPIYVPQLQHRSSPIIYPARKSWASIKLWVFLQTYVVLSPSGNIMPTTIQYLPRPFDVYYVSQLVRRNLRDFSSVGRTITDVRSRISSSKVEATELVRWGLRAELLN